MAHGRRKRRFLWRYANRQYHRGEYHHDNPNPINKRPVQIALAFIISTYFLENARPRKYPTAVMKIPGDMPKIIAPNGPARPPMTRPNNANGIPAINPVMVARCTVRFSLRRRK